MTSCTLVFMALAALAAPAPAQVKPATLVPAQSEIGFTTTQMGVPVDGRFGKFSAQIALDPMRPETGSVAFSIDTGSARFGSPELDAEVPKPTWLSALKFPQATFQSSAIRSTGAGKFEVVGKLSIKGLTHDVVVPVTLVQTGAGSTASGMFIVKRLDFQVGEGEWADTSLLANDVAVRFRLALTGMGPL